MSEIQSSPQAVQAKSEEKRAKKNHARRNRQKRRKNRRIFRLMWWVMVLMVGLLIGRYLVWIMNDVLAVNRPDIQVTIEIPSSITDLETSPSDLQEITDATQRREAEKNNQTATREVAQILKSNGIIDNVEFFCLYSNIRGADGRYHNGTWTLSQKSDFEELVHLFRSDEARQDVVEVTIPEGRNALEIAQILYEQGVISSEDAFLQELNTSDFNNTYTMIANIADLNGRYYQLEGYLFPDTYTFYKDEDPQNVLQIFLDNANQQFTQEIRDEAAEQGMTLDQLLTLASLIQAEAADTDDMYNVSSVLHNRLDYGPEYGIYTLGCDSTIYYPYRSQEDVPAAERETYESSYDTYVIEGLPAGPICNPGLDAIDAALHPNDTSYLYFCHNPETGEAYYATTQAGHQYNLEVAGLQ